MKREILGFVGIVVGGFCIGAGLGGLMQHGIPETKVQWLGDALGRGYEIGLEDGGRVVWRVPTNNITQNGNANEGEAVGAIGTNDEGAVIIILGRDSMPRMEPAHHGLRRVPQTSNP